MTYEVQQGDTLSGIAAATGTTVAVLVALNPQYRANPDLIYQGDVIVVAAPAVFDVRSYGAGGDNASRNRRAIQAATDDALDAGDAVVAFPPTGGGDYRIDGPIRIAADRDLDARIVFAGQVGRRGTRIRMANHVDPILDLSTTDGNLRGITVRDLAFYDGAAAIRMDRCAYLSLENLSFMQQYGYSIDAVNSYDIGLSNGWWVHTIGDVASTVNGSLFFDGCHFGESAGSFHVAGSLSIVGGRIYQANAKLTPGGFRDMGREVFTVTAGGKLSVTGAEIGGVDANLVNVDNADEVRITGCGIDAGAGALVNVRRCDRAYPVMLHGNTVRVRRDASLVGSVIGRTVQGVSVVGNAFMIDDSATFAAALPDGNLYESNMVWDGSL